MTNHLAASWQLTNLTDQGGCWVRQWIPEHSLCHKRRQQAGFYWERWASLVHTTAGSWATPLCARWTGTAL